MSKNPSNLSALLATAEKRAGLPEGIMQSLIQQETGGNPKYLEDPAKYHYAVNAEGKRIAGHSGKESSAFGLFGILDSTGAKPGYGVAPLKDKSLEEQVRFASEYLAGRVKQAGSLEAGLAGYGEGPAYAKQVMGRLGNQKPVSVLALPDSQVPKVIPQVQVAAAAPVVAPAAQVTQAEPQAQPVVVAQTQPQWGGFDRAMENMLQREKAIQPADLDFGNVQVAQAKNIPAPVEEAPKNILAMLKKFGVGMFAEDAGRYSASVPTFARTNEDTLG